MIKHTKPADRKGWLSIELAMTLPILMILLLGIFEFTLLFFARGDIVEASRNAARKATYSGVTEDDIKQEVLKMLPVQYHQALRLRVDLGENPGDVVSVVIGVPMQLCAPDLLWPVGFSLKGQAIICESRMIKE